MKALLITTVTLFAHALLAADLAPTHSLVELKNIQHATCWGDRDGDFHDYDCSEITWRTELSPNFEFPKFENLIIEYPVTPSGCYSAFPELDKVLLLADRSTDGVVTVRTFGEMGLGEYTTCIGYPPRRIEVSLGGWDGRQTFRIPRHSERGQKDYFTVQFDVVLEGNCDVPAENAEEFIKNSDCAYKVKNITIDQ